MITEVPTMRGPSRYGLSTCSGRRIYRQHVPQSQQALAEAQKAGLQVKDCRYVLGLPAVLTRPAATDPLMRRLGFALSTAVWWLDRHGVAIPPNGLTSPYALCIATKPKPVGR